MNFKKIQDEIARRDFNATAYDGMVASAFMNPGKEQEVGAGSSHRKIRVDLENGEYKLKPILLNGVDDDPNFALVTVENHVATFHIHDVVQSQTTAAIINAAYNYLCSMNKTGLVDFKDGQLVSRKTKQPVTENCKFKTLFPYKQQ